MTEEKREILRMLSEGKIDVDQTERLLVALEEGQHKREKEKKSTSARKHQAIQDTLSSVKEALAGVGPTVARIAGEITTEFQKERTFPGEMDAEELPPLECVDNRLPIEEGAKLFIRNDRTDGPGGGDLSIESTAGDTCEIESGDARNLRILRSSSGPVIRWSGGPLKVKVPSTVAEVFGYTLGGKADVSELHCPVQIKSMGGDLRLIGLKRRFKAKTMGGNIRLKLSKSCCEPSEAKTMGGNIRVDVAEGMPRTETRAVTMCGTILVDDGLGQIKQSGGLGQQKVTVDLGDGEPGSTLKVKTMGGNIEIRRVRHEQ
jgi:hypothetical protein